MKRFLLTIIISVLLLAAGYYLYYGKGYYFRLQNNANIDVPFYVEKHRIYHTNDSGSKPFTIKGVELDSAYGPKRGTDFAVKETTWKRWFKMIQDMGANTIRVSTVLDATFYNAFYNYNKDRKEPLYLLQGMNVATDDWETKKEAADLPFYKVLKQDGRDLIDIIHGRKLLLTNDHKGSGLYRHDISPWVLGLLLGDHWDQDMVAYIDNTLDSKRTFKGDYVAAGPEASAFEVMMAEVAEDIIGYESKKYASQHLLSVNSAFSMDPFQYEAHDALQLGKYNRFSMDHIKSAKQMKAGLFASYAYDEENLPTKEVLKRMPGKPHAADSGYLHLLRQAHEMPVVISSFGYPGESYLNHEKQQKTEIVNRLKQFATSRFDGAFIRSWQDVWNRRTLETSYAVDLQQINEWLDPLTRTQHFGLIGFKPYRSDILMKVDGKADDWQDVPAAFKRDSTKVAMTRDHTYMYLWIEDPQIHDRSPFNLALDMHPGLGSKHPDLTAKTFDRKMDFLIQINPETGTHIYVQDRYQSVRENFLEQTSGKNPFVKYPRKDSTHFEAVQYLKKDKQILTAEELEHSQKVYNYKFADVHPLRTNTISNEEEVDVMMGDGHLEMRIPYQLLNVYDPLQFTIHDDYYQHYGVNPLKINAFYLSFYGEREKPSKSVEIPVQPLEPSVRVKEYVKPSYEAVQNYWKGED